MSPGAELRSFCYIDQIQPQLAALLGTITDGDLPLAGMASLYIEVAPGSDVFRLVDVALKASDVRLGAQVVEREFGVIEFHSHDQSAVRLAGQMVLGKLGMAASDATRAEVTSVERITNVHPYQAQLLNRSRRGSMVVPGDTILVVECRPAAYINLAANQAEKAASVGVVQASSIGAYGRLWIAGRESDVEAAQTAALSALERTPG
jgi:ethanolamine utilization microcompartment shell protein EutL